jgi:hypothetical protein
LSRSFIVAIARASASDSGPTTRFVGGAFAGDAAVAGVSVGFSPLEHAAPIAAVKTRHMTTDRRRVLGIVAVSA